MHVCKLTHEEARERNRLRMAAVTREKRIKREQIKQYNEGAKEQVDKPLPNMPETVWYKPSEFPFPMVYTRPPRTSRGAVGKKLF